ncbi:hypothetical protein BKA70DRAFT_1400948, partial [Coprinopsis sp. MPI-PUGE-AT-0042]
MDTQTQLLAERLPASAWHPKLTVSRLLVITLTIGLGTAKAVTSYRGETIASITIEWVTTTLVFLLFLVLSILESERHPKPAWLFQHDTLEMVWALARKMSIEPPVYETEELTVELLVKPRHPPITLYRLMVTLSALGLGLLKAALSYLGNTTDPTTLDWILGVVVTTGLYCLGLYERSSRQVLPAIFEPRYEKQLSTVGLTATYTVGLAFSSGWTYLWYFIFRDSIIDKESSLESSDPTSAFIARMAVVLLVPLLALIPIAIGVTA